jgi:hypothetical protein
VYFCYILVIFLLFLLFLRNFLDFLWSFAQNGRLPGFPANAHFTRFFMFFFAFFCKVTAFSKVL